MQLTINVSLGKKEREKYNFFGLGQDLLGLACSRESHDSAKMPAVKAAASKAQILSRISIRAREKEPPSLAKGEWEPGFCSRQTDLQAVASPSYFSFSFIPQHFLFCQTVCP